MAEIYRFSQPMNIYNRSYNNNNTFSQQQSGAKETQKIHLGYFLFSLFQSVCYMRWWWWWWWCETSLRGFFGTGKKRVPSSFVPEGKKKIGGGGKWTDLTRKIRVDTRLHGYFIYRSVRAKTNSMSYAIVTMDILWGNLSGKYRKNFVSNDFEWFCT